MFNQIEEGRSIMVAIPGGGCSSNTPLLIGNDTIGVPENTYGAGTAGNVTVHLRGVFGDLPLKAADAPNVGDKLYWDNGNSWLTVTAGELPFAGWCMYAPTANGALQAVALKLKG